MQVHRLRFISGLVVLTLLSLAAHGAQPGDTRIPVTIKLSVSASDSIKDAVIRCLTEELRALNDVRLVDDKPQWEISVLALDVRSTRGYRGGIAISALMLPRFQNERIADLLRPAERASGLAQTSSLWEYPGHFLHMDAVDRLRILCSQVAAEFDERRLEKRRRHIHDTREPRDPDRPPRVDETVK